MIIGIGCGKESNVKRSMFGCCEKVLYMEHREEGQKH